MAKISFDNPPKEAIEYLSKKYPELHFDYDEIVHEAHHRAFTVAKITKLDLLKDIQESIIEAKKSGESFESWKKGLVPILKKKGWWGHVRVTNPKTGEEKEIFVGSRRLRTIFFTNTRVAYNVGRWKHQSRLDDAPYLRYVSILDSHTRPSHKSMNGVIRHRDDDFWATNYPPNGWNCRCRVQALSMDSIKSRKWEDKLKAPVKNIASKDWAYDVRKGGIDKLIKLYKKRAKSSKLDSIIKDTALIKAMDAISSYIKHQKSKKIALGSIESKSVYLYKTTIQKQLKSDMPKYLYSSIPLIQSSPDLVLRYYEDKIEYRLYIKEINEKLYLLKYLIGKVSIELKLFSTITKAELKEYKQKAEVYHGR